MPADPQGAPGEPLAAPATVPAGSWRDRIRSKPGLRHAYRVAVFVVGLMLIAAGFALAFLPGPLTIPPVLLGLYVWSTEFAWAERLFDAFAEKGREAWAHAKRHPWSSGAITVGGLVAAGAIGWAVVHYDLVARAREVVGL